MSAFSEDELKLQPPEPERESTRWSSPLFLFKREQVLLVLSTKERRPGSLGLERRRLAEHGSSAIELGARNRNQSDSIWIFWAPYVTDDGDSTHSEVSSSPLTTESPSVLNRREINIRPLDRRDSQAFQVRIDDLLAIRRYLPAIGYPRVRFTRKGGEIYPELAFQSGGLRDFLNALRKCVELEADATDPDLFYVRAVRFNAQPQIADGFEMHSSRKSIGHRKAIRRLSASPAALAMLVQEQPAHVQIGSAPMPNVQGSSQGSFHERNAIAPDASSSSATSAETREESIPGPSPEGEEELTFHLLERFSQITRLARAATSSLGSAYRRRQGSKQRNAVDDLISETVHDADEEDVAQQEPFSSIAVQFENGEIVPPLRTLDRDFQVYRPLRSAPRVSREAFQRGRRLDPLAMRRAIFAGGLEHDARAVAWPYLLGVFDWTISPEEEQEQRRLLENEYLVLKQQWESISEKQERRFSKYRDRRVQIEKDVIRTDRGIELFRDDNSTALRHLFNILLTHAFFNFDLGYCQGMSDLAAPIVYILGSEEEALAFWCFASLMDVLERNFRKDQSGMNEELSRLALVIRHIDPKLYNYLRDQQAEKFYFCFRWLLVRFKREFQFEQVLYLWDVMWAAPSTAGGGLFHLYIAAALLELHRDIILEYHLTSDELFSYTNRMAMRNDAELVIAKAELLFKEYGLPAELELQLDLKHAV
ncbi:hypothetical protein CCYA_CCYA10G2968 [Cyanidiococcus yangmingshanensis]|nr:hypothetical protein CCYA_CCYA10G2968 [Cyanidiococcus yangmingshanensis]